MKRPGSDLGNLSSIFFAYVKLKEKDIIRIDEGALVISISESNVACFIDCRSVFHILSDRRFNEYIPSRPLMGLGFFSCFE